MTCLVESWEISVLIVHIPLLAIAGFWLLGFDLQVGRTNLGRVCRGCNSKDLEASNDRGK
jgi:hypothetical protein